MQELYGRGEGAEPGAWDERDAPLRAMLRHVGEGVVVRSPFYCEGGNIGDRAFVNGDAVVLDLAQVTIGAAWQLATRVQLLTATPPIAIGGGAEVIRQDLEAGVVDELAIIVAPVVLGAGWPVLDARIPTVAPRNSAGRTASRVMPAG